MSIGTLSCATCHINMVLGITGHKKNKKLPKNYQERKKWEFLFLRGRLGHLTDVKEI